MSEAIAERPYPTFKSLPIEVKVYIGILQAIFIPVLVLVLSKNPFAQINWLDFLIFTTLGSIFTAKPLIITSKGEIQCVSSLFHISALFLFRPEQVFFIVFFSFLIGNILGRSRSWAILINYSEISLALYLASLSYHKLRAIVPYYENIIANLPAIIIAIVIGTIINHLLHLLVFMFLYKEETFWDAVRVVTGDLFVFELPQFPISVALALAYHYQRVSLLLFLLPILLFYILSHYQSRIHLKEQEAVEERKRIEQDAHDRIYNKLGALAKKAELAAGSGEAKGEAKKTLDLLQKDLRIAVKDLQNIVSAENKTVAEDNGLLITELENICSNFKNCSSIELDFNFEEAAVNNIGPKDFWHLQCILDECFNNIIKHSEATQVRALIKKDNGQVVLRVEDNGVGIKDKTDGVSGKGLSGMQSRAQKMGASVSFAPNNGKGTAVELRLPI